MVNFCKKCCSVCMEIFARSGLQLYSMVTSWATILTFTLWRVTILLSLLAFSSSIILFPVKKKPSLLLNISQFLLLLREREKHTKQNWDLTTLCFNSGSLEVSNKSHPFLKVIRPNHWDAFCLQHWGKAVLEEKGAYKKQNGNASCAVTTYLLT